MAERSQAVTWKLLGLAPDQRVCEVCGRSVRLQDMAGYIVREGVVENGMWRKLPRVGPKLRCVNCKA